MSSLAEGKSFWRRRKCSAGLRTLQTLSLFFEAAASNISSLNNHNTMADELVDAPPPHPAFPVGRNSLASVFTTPTPPHTYYINQRVSIKSVLGTVRYIGLVEGTENEWVGIEWDDPSRGKHDGSHKGKRYFKCWSFSLFIISPGFLYQVRSKPISNRRFLHPYNSIER